MPFFISTGLARRIVCSHTAVPEKWGYRNEDYAQEDRTDQNRVETKGLYEAGFKRSGYRTVQYREIPGFGHGIPNGTELEKALSYLSPEAGEH